MNTFFASKRSSLLVALAAIALAGCGGSGGGSGALAAPKITTQPKNVTANVGGSATFRVSASGKGLTYQWFRNASAIPGATSATLTINPVSAQDFGTYYVQVTNATSVVNSGFATLSLPSNGSPRITTQPTSVSVASGASATFTVVASGDGTLTYQWFKNGAEIAGATSASYTIPSVSSTDLGNYYVTVTNDKGSIDSNVVTLSISVPSAPTITTQPVSKQLAIGQTSSLTVVAAGSPPLSYQWFKDGTEIAGATTSVLNIGPASSSDAGDYSVEVSNSLGTVRSATATVVVSAAPVIVSQPTNQTVSLNESVTFTVQAAGSNLSYQWYKGATPISGATGPSFTINSAKATDVGTYHVVVTNFAGSVSSDNVTLTVISPPTITSQPVSTTVGKGNSVSFTVNATGTGTLTYQWFKDGTAISGATSKTFTIAAAADSDEADYYVEVSNSAGPTRSNTVTLTVRDAPTITSQPQTINRNVGQSASFSVTATGEGTLTYQWYKDGVAISGATSATFTLDSVTEGDEATYYVRVYSDNVIYKQSDNASLIVN